jgi:hypothetical protein
MSTAKEHKGVMMASKKVLAIVLAGGEGKRLMPLTGDRAKPAGTAAPQGCGPPRTLPIPGLHRRATAIPGIAATTPPRKKEPHNHALPTEKRRVTTDEYVRDWTRIRTRDEIKLSKDSQEIARGLADGVTHDGNTLWLIQFAGKGRSMFNNQGGILAFRTNTSTPSPQI